MYLNWGLINSHYFHLPDKWNVLLSSSWKFSQKPADRKHSMCKMDKFGEYLGLEWHRMENKGEVSSIPWICQAVRNGGIFPCCHHSMTIQTTLIFFTFPVDRESNPWLVLILRFPLISLLKTNLMHKFEVYLHNEWQSLTRRARIQGGVMINWWPIETMEITLCLILFSLYICECFLMFMTYFYNCTQYI